MRYSSKHTFSYRSVFWRHKTLKKRQFKKSKYFQFQKLKTPSHYKTDFKNKNHANKYNYFSAETDGALSGFSLRQPFWPFFKWNSSFLAFLTIADSFVYGYNCLWGLSSNYCGDSYSAWYKCFMPHISIQFFRLPTLFKSLSIYPVAAGETTHWGGGFLEKKKLPINFLGNVPPLDVSHWYVLKKKINKHGFVARDMVLNYGFKNFILENKMFYPLLDNIKVFKNFIFSLQADTGVISTLEYGAIYRLAQSLSSLLSSNTSPHKATKLGLLPTFKYFIFTYLRSYRRVVSGFTINRKHLTHKVYRQARKSKKKTRFLVRTLKRCFYYLFRALRKKKKLYRVLVRKSNLTLRLKKTRHGFYINRLETFKLKNIKPLRSLSFRFRNNLSSVLKRRLVFNTVLDSRISRFSFYRNTPSHPNNFKFFGQSNFNMYFSKKHFILYFFINPFFLKTHLNPYYLGGHSLYHVNFTFWQNFLHLFSLNPSHLLSQTNILPNVYFKHIICKKILASRVNSFLSNNTITWAYNNVVRFMEFCSSKKILFQVYSYITQHVDHEFSIIYRRWMPRMRYYERRLGHRFFLGEALNIIHLSFFMHDVKLFSSWLKAIIRRISFWKTRLIFRFLKYLLQTYFFYIFDLLNVKGFKVRLKGKISVAGNSRKRTILYRIGATSHSTVNLKVLHEFDTINTFTGVMGFQIWIFY